MTRGRVFGKEQPFHAWVRLHCLDAQRGLAISDIDLCAFRWDTGRLGLFEIKTRGATVPFAQQDILRTLDALLRLGADTGKPVRTARGRRTVGYAGFYLVRLSGTTPEDSDRILVNGAPVTKDQLARLLSLEDGDAHEHAS